MMVDPRKPLAGRYSFAGLLRTTQGPRRWLATDGETGRRVVVAIVEAGRLGVLEAARGVKQRHVTAVIDVLRKVEPEALPEGAVVPAGGGVAVAEYMAGRTIRQLLESGPVNPTKAVAWTIRLAESVQALHEAGSVHGAISPRSVIGEPEGRKLPPVLSQLVALPLAPFCPPERLKGSAEAASDDVWALHALLYTALTREPPFKADSREALARQMMTGKPKPLSAFGIDEPALDEILSRGLVGEKRLRVSELAELAKLLDAWERDPKAMPPKRAAAPRPAPRSFAAIVGTGLSGARDESIIVDDDALPDDEGQELKPVAPPLGELSQAPARAATPVPPLAQGFPTQSSPNASATPLPSQPNALTTPLAVPGAPLPPKRPSINPFEKKKQVWPLLAGAALAGGLGVYLAVAPGSAPEKKEATSAQAAIAPAPIPTPSTTAKKRNAREERNACVMSYFEPGAFQGEPDFAFVCEGDLREVAIQLYDMAAPEMPAADAGAADGGDALGPPKDAGVRGTGLGWYELPATAIIRKHCCVGSVPILPETPGWCEQLQSAVKRVADESVGAGDLAPHARAFDKAVNCLFANKVPRPYVYDKPPNDWNRRAFQQFLGRAAVSEARR